MNFANCTHTVPYDFYTTVYLTYNGWYRLGFLAMNWLNMKTLQITCQSSAAKLNSSNNLTAETNCNRKRKEN